MIRSFFFAVTAMFACTALAADLPVFDKEFSCFNKVDADRYVSDFNINVKSFGGMELCDSKLDTKKLFNDLSLVEQGAFDVAPQNVFIRNYVASAEYYKWLKQQTRGMNRGNDIPHATAYNSWGYFTMQDGWATLSTLGRVGVVIHEARHTEGYRHIPCTHGPYEGSSNDGCDKDYEYGGSHAVEMEYYGRVVTAGRNFHPIYKSMARLMAMGRSNMMFNKSPIQVREVLTALDKDGRPAIVDEGKVTVRDGLTVAPGRLKRASHGASLFYGKMTYAIDLYSFRDQNANMEDAYSYYKLLFLDKGQGPDPMKDFEEVDIGTRRFAVGIKNDGTISSYQFAQGKWGPFANQNANAVSILTTSPAGEHGVFVLMNDGSIYRYDALKMTYGAPLTQRWPKELAAITTVNGQMISLSTDGRVSSFQEKAWSEFLPLKGVSISQIVSSPIYDAFVVEK